MKKSQDINENQLTFALSNEEVKAYVNAYYDIQKVRIETENRLRMFQQERTANNPETKYPQDILVKELHQSEQIAQKLLTEYIRKEKIWNHFLKNVTGIGTILSCCLVSTIQNPAKFENPAKLWAYAGLRPRTYCADCKKLILDDREKDNYFSSIQTWLLHQIKMKNTKKKTEDEESQDINESQGAVCEKSHYGNAAHCKICEKANTYMPPIVFLRKSQKAKCNPL